MFSSIPFSNSSITVFNQYFEIDEFNKKKPRWTSYVIKNSLFAKQQKTKINEYVQIDSDYYIAQAPINDDYLPYEEWIKLVSSKEVDKKFTVQNGDIIVKGEFDIEIPENSSPILELSKNYGNIEQFTAKTAQVNVSNSLTLNFYYWAG